MTLPRIIELPKIEDERGNLSFIESLRHCPFSVKRAYWVYDVPGGATRGGHAYFEQQELIVALSGSFEVVLTDGTQELSFRLSRSYYGLFVPAGWWRRMVDFSTNAVGLVLASTDYASSDYIYEYSDFLARTPRHVLNSFDPSGIAPRPTLLPTYKSSRTTVADCGIRTLRRIASNRRGNLTPLYRNDDVPFQLARTFYIYDIPGGESRGGHAHKECHEYLIAVSGSFEVSYTDGTNQHRVTLTRPYEGFHLVPGVWAQEMNFSSGAICLVFTSHPYEEEDYIRDWNAYLAFKQQNR